MSKTIPSEVKWCLDTTPSTGGSPAYQKVFGSDPVDLFGWGDGDEDWTFPRETSLAGHFVQQ